MFLRLPMSLARFLNNGRLRILLLFLIVLLVLGICITYNNWPTDAELCFRDVTPAISKLEADEHIALEDVLLGHPKPRAGRSIFFHETSCHLFRKEERKQGKKKEYKLLQLTPRQACAIESAALHNPNFDIFVLFADPTYKVTKWRNGSLEQSPLIEAILGYNNVHLRSLNLWTYSEGTPIEAWFKDGQLFQSRYLFSHLSDFLRYLTLYRYGGLYLDMDVVVLRSMEDIPPNYTGAESHSSLAAGVMNFAAHGFGHEIAESCLRDFQQNFDGSDWGQNGPGVITRVAQKICGTQDISLMIEDSKRCLGFKVYSRGAFYAIPWRQWQDFFEPHKLETTMARAKDSYVIHVWNKHSSKLKIRYGTKSAYAQYAESNCPRALAASGEYF
ncbi:uncharacterized protein Dwil_GK15176 [Drosophila willistoni]|uniref:Alpha 1,4-glycosyltransferase domain-containing protein n=1 Tax=Drosophila willistoni TaxID=7260 RepID=B4MW12_DROWI|nr:lactosylceramide 4-alpha-galactosyltransferase [Drosophila willistoni]EDW75882.1 uncharacterized protein Dwil_GK15176 [Drosophila willistoni]